MGGLVHLFQRIFKLGVRHLEFGQFKDQRVAALQQRGEQFTLRAQLRFQNAVLFAGERLSVGLAKLSQLRLLVEQILITHPVHTQLRHFGIKLLRFRHLRQSGDLRTQRFAEHIGCAKPLRLFAQGVERLANLQGLAGRLPLLRGDQIHTLRLLIQCLRQFAVNFELRHDPGG